MGLAVQLTSTRKLTHQAFTTEEASDKAFASLTNSKLQRVFKGDDVT
jgi:hypothetical protein